MLKTLRSQVGMTLMELILAGVVFAIIAPGIPLVFNKGMKSFFFERDELVVQRDIRSVMDKIIDDLRKASSIDVATQTDVYFNDSSKRYYLNGENIKDIGAQPVNSSEVKVVNLSFSYYGEDMENPLSFPVDVSEVKAVGIKMKFKANDNPVLQIESWVLIRNL